MVEDRCIVSIKVVCALSIGDIADDLEWPLTTPKRSQFLHFVLPFISS